MIFRIPTVLGLISVVLAAACGDEVDPNATDITNVFFAKTDANCLAYVGSYKSAVRDVARGVEFAGRVTITDEGSSCAITSNSIPNHDFNDGNQAFVNSSAEATMTFSIPASPQAAGSTTDLTLQYDDAIFLNGVKHHEPTHLSGWTRFVSFGSVFFRLDFRRYVSSRGLFLIGSFRRTT